MGSAGFEPAASSAQGWHHTKLDKDPYNQIKRTLLERSFFGIIKFRFRTPLYIACFNKILPHEFSS